MLRNSAADVTDAQMAELYDEAIRPAAQDILSDSVHDWPTSFKAAQFKDRNHGAGFANSGVIIAERYLQNFDQRLRGRIRDHDDLILWAGDYFWGTEIRGVKDSFYHPMTAPEEQRHHILGEVTQDVDTSYGDWYIDVGLEFIIGGQALLWSTDAHSRVLQAAVGISARQANDIISQPSKFTQDVSTHLPSLSGCRAILDPTLNPLGIVYGASYTSDKSQTYHPENGRFSKTLTPKIAMHGNPPSWCQSLLNLYRDAASNVDVAARLEVRVPLENAEQCLVTFPEDVIRESLVCYKREIWW